jgi:predicted porin
MKKTLIALAAVAVSSAAMAQVTISGTYSVSYQQDLTSTTENPVLAPGLTGASKNDMVPLTYGKAKGLAVTDAAIRVAATEDIGGGVRAAADFTFETGAQRGTTVTRADSGVSLSGGFGTVAYRNTRTSDLIASIGSSAISLPDGLYDSTGIVSRSAVDTLAYTSPRMSGLAASITMVENNEGNIAAAATNKGANVVGLSYVNGPLTLAIAHKTKAKAAAASSGLTSEANNEFSIAYDMGVARFAVAYDEASVTGTSSASAGAFASTTNARAVADLQTKAATGFSVTVPLGKFSIGAQQFKRDVAKVTEFGVRYDLTKRTAISASSGKKSGLAQDLGFNGSQYRVRVGHTF